MDVGKTYQVVLHLVPLREQAAFYDQQKELPLPERKERLRFDLQGQNLYLVGCFPGHWCSPV